nr:MAG TPA: hypothetical protein [Caudoviricetes sp.]
MYSITIWMASVDEPWRADFIGLFILQKIS